METLATRLKQAREAAGFETAIDAADSLGVKRSTYIGHENGSRGYRADSAEVYARRFKVSAEWLLYGRGRGPAGEANHTAEIIDLFEHMPPERRSEALDILRLLARKSEATG